MDKWVNIKKKWFVPLVKILQSALEKDWLSYSIPEMGEKVFGINGNSFKQYCTHNETSVSLPIIYKLEKVLEDRLNHINIDDILVIRIKLGMPAGWLIK